ncbi:MAG: hypothetical protein DRN40_01350 [Thermoplasmata archaeon]|nr:MAG: hypothetical protein DRN40_01350 [Thermoplasmata archaeon]
MDIVVDEWFPEYLRDRERMHTALEVMERIFEKCDSMVIMENSPLMKKIRQILKESNHWSDVRQMEILRFFIHHFLTNSLKLHLRSKGLSTVIPEDIKKAVPDLKDLYLFETLLPAISSEGEGIILTTDVKLKNNSGPLSKYIVLLDYFLENYPFEEGDKNG